MTIFIYHRGSENLKVLLTQLQSQLSQSDDIYIYDPTPKRSGLTIARLYGSSKCYIFVEVGNLSYIEALQTGWQSCRENSQDGLLVIDENCVISNTLIPNIKKASESFDIISPIVIKTPYPQMPSEFKWHNQFGLPVIEIDTFSRLLYYEKLTKNAKLGLLTSETAVILPFGNKNTI